jgi:hypothetical protein
MWTSYIGLPVCGGRGRSSILHPTVIFTITCRSSRVRRNGLAFGWGSHFEPLLWILYPHWCRPRPFRLWFGIWDSAKKRSSGMDRLLMPMTMLLLYRLRFVVRHDSMVG